jgi:hypothetical protein
VGGNGDSVVLNNSNIFYSHFALDIFNAKQFFRQKIEKFNDESPKSVKRINGSGCFKHPFDYLQQLSIFALPATSEE